MAVSRFRQETPVHSVGGGGWGSWGDGGMGVSTKADVLTALLIWILSEAQQIGLIYRLIMESEFDSDQT